MVVWLWMCSEVGLWRPWWRGVLVADLVRCEVAHIDTVVARVLPTHHLRQLVLEHSAPGKQVQVQV